MGNTIAQSARSLQYYVIAKHWASDTMFFQIETAFLHHLLEDYAIRIFDSIHIGKLKHIGKKLFKLEKDEQHADKVLTEHLEHLELLNEDVIKDKEEELAARHVQLEYLMTDLTHDYREVKKKIFILVESIMQENAFLAS